MSKFRHVKLPEEWGLNSEHADDGECLDCGAPATVHKTDKAGTIVVHGGDMCEKFRRRFTPKPGKEVSIVGDETGEVIRPHSKHRELAPPAPPAKV